jgi:predicted transcriptional regulator of viral defense system
VARRVKHGTVVKPQAFFAARPVFTYADFAAAIDRTARSKRTLDSLLSYYVETGRIVRVRRGLYLAVPPGADPAKCPLDPYLVAAKLTEDAVLAYHTALEFHGRARSVMERFHYLTARRSRPLEFRGLRFRAVPFPKALRDAGRESLGVKTAERRDVDLRVTTLERTLVDLLDRPDLGGGWEEIWLSFESVEFFDIDRVVEYALALDNATTAAKVGFYLQSHREPLMVAEEHLKRLRDRRPKEPHYLERRSRKPARLAPEWNLMVPAEILDRSWEEPA